MTLEHTILTSAGQVWPPFVLVTGLLLIGAVAAADGLFEALGARLARARLGGRGLLLALLGLVATVTAVLNLDTSVVFLTPVLVHAARRRRLDERPFLYGAVFMANAASLLLPGSNLTNLLVLRTDPQSSVVFAARMLPAWIAACAITAAFVVVAFRLGDGEDNETEPPPVRLGVGAAGTLAAAVLVVSLKNAALPVLAVGLAATALRRLRPRIDARLLVPLFVLAVGLGTGARLWHGPAHLLDSSRMWATAGLGAIASVLLNNLPAAVLLSAQPAAHPNALLLGLDIGPNLAFTGSLSAVLWLQAARGVGAHPSLRDYSRLGLMLVPLTLAATLAALLAPRLGTVYSNANAAYSRSQIGCGEWVRQNSRTASLNSSGRSRLLRCPALGITTSWASGIARSNWRATYHRADLADLGRAGRAVTEAAGRARPPRPSPGARRENSLGARRRPYPRAAKRTRQAGHRRTSPKGWDRSPRRGLPAFDSHSRPGRVVPPRTATLP